MKSGSRKDLGLSGKQKISRSLRPKRIRFKFGQFSVNLRASAQPKNAAGPSNGAKRFFCRFRYFFPAFLAFLPPEPPREQSGLSAPPTHCPHTDHPPSGPARGYSRRSALHSLPLPAKLSLRRTLRSRFKRTVQKKQSQTLSILRNAQKRHDRRAGAILRKYGNDSDISDECRPAPAAVETPHFQFQ